jgi:hypothetical protein
VILGEVLVLGLLVIIGFLFKILVDLILFTFSLKYFKVFGALLFKFAKFFLINLNGLFLAITSLLPHGVF